MKKLTIGIVVVICVLLIGCFDIQFDNSPKGNWTHIGIVETYSNEDTCVIVENFYKPEIDQYYLTTIVKITDNEMIFYQNDDGENFNIDTMYTVSYSNDSLYVSPYGYSDTTAMAYYFNKNKNMVCITEDYGDYKNEWHFEKLNGVIPPESWLTDIEADEYEPDGDIMSATSIRFNSRQSHTLTENDSDYYKIQAQAGKSYLIQSLGYFNMELYLFDQEGDSLAYDLSNDLRIKNLGDEVMSVIFWTCNETGDYYPAIIPRYYRSSRGYYQMLVTEVDTNDIEYGEPWGVYGGTRCDKSMDIFKNKMNK